VVKLILPGFYLGY